MGRFINADAYTSTGQGLVGNNMFAYCNNNPVNHYDSNGKLPQAVEDAIVHRKVLKAICGQDDNLRRTQTCIYYNGVNFLGGWGFCDLYNISTGEVWELKKNSSSYSCTTAAATAQLSNYVSGSLKHHPDLELFTPYKTQILDGKTTLMMNGYVYDVTYWNEGNGILRYDYTKSKTDTRRTAEVIVAATITTAVVAYFAPHLLPGMVTMVMPVLAG